MRCGPRGRAGAATTGIRRRTATARSHRLVVASLACGFLALAAAPTRLPAQVIQGVYNPRDDQYRLLGLVRAQAELERAQNALARAEELYRTGGITLADLEDARAAYSRARVNYLQQSLAVIFAAPHVTIERAVKGRAPDGGTTVRLTLRNTTTNDGEAARLSELIDQELLRRLDPDEIRDVYVSLKAEPGLAGAIISSPYELRIAAMRAGEPVTVEFRLLRDADEVVVSINYADKVEEKTVFLETDPSADIVTVQSVQFSQEADLGGQAVYDLRLERFTREANVFRLAVAGLPRDIRYEFRDTATDARLSQVRFPEGRSQRDLRLTVSLPERAGGSLTLDEPLRFWALVLDDEAAAELSQLTAVSDRPGDDAIAAIDAGKTRLELVPHGVGRIEVRALNLYHEVPPGDSVVLAVRVRNTGSRRVDHVLLRANAPLDWRARVEPERIEALPVGGEGEAHVILVPPKDVVVGDYEARLDIESAAAGRRITTEGKTVRIHVPAGANWLGIGLLLLALSGLVVGVLVLGSRLARR